jgi:hypothetical protein
MAKEGSKETLSVRLEEERKPQKKKRDSSLRSE